MPLYSGTQGNGCTYTINKERGVPTFSTAVDKKKKKRDVPTFATVVDKEGGVPTFATVVLVEKEGVYYFCHCSRELRRGCTYFCQCGREGGGCTYFCRCGREGWGVPTFATAIEKEGRLDLELQLISNGLHPVLQGLLVKDHHTMDGTC